MSETQTMREVIQEIHTQFDTAADRLVNEAQSIINRDKAEVINKRSIAYRMEKLGFIQAKPVKEQTEKMRKYQEAVDLVKHIDYCRVAYPLYKFITDDEVKRICDKYGLALGDAFKYIGDIPLKNLEEIEGFRLRKEDSPVRYMEVGYFSRNSGRISREMRMVDEYMATGMMIMGVDPIQPIRSQQPDADVKPSFKIVAPIQDFKVNFDDRMEGHKLIHDPVVLCPIRGGNLVITKWGLEASDPILLNEQHN